MRRIKIVLSYDGTEFHGWQVQPGLRTIQREVQAVVSEIEGRAVDVAASGRTDAGVHAYGQVAAFSIANPIPCPNLKLAMNRLLPRSVRIVSVEDAAADFHPRFQARAKTYRYRIWRAEVCPPFERLYVHHHPYRLDEAAMMDSAALFEGEHDFTAFAASDDRDDLGRSMVRQMYSSRLERQGELLIYEVRGRGFLKHMVRNMVGVLLEVGKGNFTKADVMPRLEPGCEIPPGPSVPGRGLFLVGVEY